MEKYHIIVKGVVQGVGFRFFTKNTAKSLGINGSVENKSDGSVEIFCQANKEQIDTFVEKLKLGPSMSKVDSVKAEKHNYDEDYSDFFIR